MNVLPESWPSLVNLFAGGETVWRTPSQIAEALRAGEEETTDLLASLHVDGLLDVWERDSGPVVTLSPLGASIANLKIVEHGRLETPRWGRIGDPHPPVPRARCVAATARGGILDTLADRYPTQKLLTNDARPAPSLLIGLGKTPWPTSSPNSFSLCPVCGSRRLPSHAYCLWCDRWGGDLSDADRSQPQPNAKRTNTNPPRDTSCEDKAARANRKAKRQQRMSQRLRDAQQSKSLKKRSSS